MKRGKETQLSPFNLSSCPKRHSPSSFFSPFTVKAGLLPPSHAVEKIPLIMKQAFHIGMPLNANKRDPIASIMLTPSKLSPLDYVILWRLLNINMSMPTTTLLEAHHFSLLFISWLLKSRWGKNDGHRHHRFSTMVPSESSRRPMISRWEHAYTPSGPCDFITEVTMNYTNFAFNHGTMPLVRYNFARSAIIAAPVLTGTCYEGDIFWPCMTFL